MVNDVRDSFCTEPEEISKTCPVCLDQRQRMSERKEKLVLQRRGSHATTFGALSCHRGYSEVKVVRVRQFSFFAYILISSKFKRIQL